MSKFIRALSLMIIFILVLIPLGAAAFAPSDTPEAETSQASDFSDVKGDNVLILNMDTDVVLFEKCSEEPVYLGFLPRIMTVLIALKEIPSPESHTVSITSEMIKLTPQLSSAALSAGEEISAEDLIKCVLICNSQEACVALALDIGGSISGFIAKMNSYASELNAMNTRFTNVHGYYKPGAGKSTVSDAALIITELCKYEKFISWAGLPYADLTVSGKNRRIYAHNSIIVPSSKHYVAGAGGIAAYSGNNAPVSGADYIKDSGMRLLCIEASYGSISDLYTDMSVLLKASAEKYVTERIISAGSAVCEVSVKMGMNRDSVTAAACSDINVTHRDDVSSSDYKISYEVPESVTAPIAKGADLGTVKVYLGNKLEGEARLEAKTAVEVDRLEQFTENLNVFFANPVLWVIICAVIGFVLFYVILLYRASRKRAKRLKSARHERIKMDID